MNFKKEVFKRTPKVVVVDNNIHITFLKELFRTFYISLIFTSKAPGTRHQDLSMGAFSVNFNFKLFFGDFFVIFNFVKVEWSDKIYDIFCTGSSNHGVERPDTDARRGVNFLRSFRPERVLPSGAASLAAQAT